MKKALATILTLSCATPSIAADIDITIQNLTRGIYFTPLLVAAHPSTDPLFTIGTAATTELQQMAEGGEIDSLAANFDAIGATQSNNPANGLLAPGQSTTTNLNTDNAPANTYLSITAMLLPTNDGFVALNGLSLPSEPGTYIYNINAYDAGTEANDEIRGGGAPGVPGFPVPGALDNSIGTNGVGISANVEGFVHIHRGVLGDSDATGGQSDINNTLHRWANPVARLTIVVN